MEGIMATTPPEISLYATRWKPFLAAIGFAGGLVVDLLSYFVWPIPVVTSNPWEYQEPARTILFIFALLICAALVLLGLYWTITTRPLLQLNASCLVYRPFPLPTRVIYWADVDHISAFTTQRGVLFSHNTVVTLFFSLKLYGTFSVEEQQVIHIDIGPGTVSRTPQELVRLLQNYHTVQYFEIPMRTKAGSRTRRRR
jgi:hypothetical protein